VNISFQEEYMASRVGLYGHEHNAIPFIRLYNLSIIEDVDGLIGVQKAYFTMRGVNKPTQASFWRVAEWLLCSPYNQSHSLKINIEFTYFNGKAYKKVVQPFILKVFPDNNNTFETAEELKANQTRRGTARISYDSVDWYKIWLQKGVTANFILRYVDIDLIDMYVYDSSKTLKACIFKPVNATLTQITLNINETGWWYIKISVQSSHFVYAIFVTTKTQGNTL